MAALRVAIATLGFRGRPKQVLDWLAENAFHEVELPVQGEPFGLSELDQSGVRDLKHQLASRLLLPVSVFAEVAGSWNRSNEAEEALERVQELILRYGLSFRVPLVLELGALAEGEGASPKILEEALARLRELVEQAELPVLLTGPLLTTERVRQIVAKWDSPFLGLALDPGSLLEVEADWLFWLEEWGAYIRHIYAVDGRPRGGLVEPCPVGQGAVPWAELVERLDQLDYAGPLVIRPDRLPDPFGDALRAREYLRRLRD